ncbi:hypothetical protein A3F07_02170 [candidate division WWE3 bacterium RIFCSPHIGHO2_12_FULL_38_15]|uniref:Mannosyl-glycoprotein endo-beta-N-acetylglucosamidase-like domain-containing protein n=1 Tax=candidate division WWE3 bacterium RIFCSPHIGHO2_02_FULL_38_14 TaxID=1802620 RepID=A0A1F4V8E8_UNCKA|nr:MAG: hypothetical protein A2793_03405 [candidate division WWE3 bacterium RIFCSPHIGHO2_01_FULL_38_45]OGC48687.1 MAG: hypothetical protein A3F07_02170 [candidate division WWE3 bacterium RIFCSPHIGHO2_12_FULL_38_15]OGC53093.1 MAG: hypothetical protein A3B64_01430 [candidate division WWE3 bacterium RIFCSPLOWO2_01_FULL_37_24]OGC53456.1 MAG: hypothetical protein A3D91_00285 [candidate division WWE3 bacterium RIFCSPHIGHO2_02_FULL_38_14]HLB51930.1 hypothetical protein [Patescibacteria group bacterium
MDRSIPEISFKKFWLPITWFGSTFFVLLVTLFTLFLSFSNPKPHITDKYSIFSAKPLVLGDSTFSLDSVDARAVMLDNVFEKYGCPLYGTGRIFVEEADLNNLPFWLAASVAFQESSCGKNTPVKEGVESYNAWGWGVYGDNVKMFENWEEGISTVSEFLNNRFYKQGVTEPCEIMKIYTPSSGGSWCNGVEFFGDIISNYKTPENT